MPQKKSVSKKGKSSVVKPENASGGLSRSKAQQTVQTNPSKADTNPQQSQKEVPHDLQMLAVTLTLDELLRTILPETEPKASSFNASLADAKAHLNKAVLRTKKLAQSDRNIALSHFYSMRALPGYSTLDSEHISDIQELVSNISKYSADPSKTRPLTALMIAAPGAGKSHFIKCLAARLRGKDIVPITYNMAAMEHNEDLSQALDSARNLKVEDKLPLIFLDEFDSNPKNYSLLLPLLWDGEIHLGHRDLKLGKVIMVLAGSKPRLPELLELARSMQLNADAIANPVSEDAKLIDLLSRINAGTIQIPSLELREGERDRRLDKICIGIALLMARFGDQLSEVPRSLLKFIAMVQFRYGVRSIAHLIDLIPHLKRPTKLTKSRLHLPLSRLRDLRKSSLAYHLLDEEQGHSIVELWKACGKNDIDLRIGQKALMDILQPTRKPRSKRKKKSKK